MGKSCASGFLTELGCADLCVCFFQTPSNRAIWGGSPGSPTGGRPQRLLTLGCGITRGLSNHFPKVLGVANYSCLLLCFVLVFGSMLAVLLSRGADLRTGKYLAGDGKCLEHPWRGSF